MILMVFRITLIFGWKMGAAATLAPKCLGHQDPTIAFIGDIAAFSATIFIVVDTSVISVLASLSPLASSSLFLPLVSLAIL